MLRFLIIEDDSFKCEDLAIIVLATFPDANISYASDVATGVKKIESGQYNLVIIDMALPSHPVVSGGGSPMSLLNGGLEIIFELNSLGRSDDCVIVTQYPEIKIAGRSIPIKDVVQEIKEKFDCDIVACIEYSDQKIDWKYKFINLLNRYENINTRR